MGLFIACVAGVERGREEGSTGASAKREESARRGNTNTDTTLQMNITWLRIPTGRRQTSWLFYKRGLGDMQPFMKVF